MGELDLRAEYERILAEHHARPAPAGRERRRHPRLKVRSSDLWISTVPEFELVDMSASGLAIRSNAPMRPGELIHISLGTTLSVDAEVVDSRMDQPPDEYTDGEFRIQCRFLEDLEGMELLVKAIRGN